MADQEPAGLKEQNEKVRTSSCWMGEKHQNRRPHIITWSESQRFVTFPLFCFQFSEYKAPEKVYKKWTPNKAAQGKAFTGVSPST